jgi:hypothetical protein
MSTLFLSQQLQAPREAGHQPPAQHSATAAAGVCTSIARADASATTAVSGLGSPTARADASSAVAAGLGTRWKRVRRPVQRRRRLGPSGGACGGQLRGGNGLGPAEARAEASSAAAAVLGPAEARAEASSAAAAGFGPAEARAEPDAQAATAWAQRRRVRRPAPRRRWLGPNGGACGGQLRGGASLGHSGAVRRGQRRGGGGLGPTEARAEPNAEAATAWAQWRHVRRPAQRRRRRRAQRRHVRSPARRRQRPGPSGGACGGQHRGGNGLGPAVACAEASTEAATAWAQRRRVRSLAQRRRRLGPSGSACRGERLGSATARAEAIAAVAGPRMLRFDVAAGSPSSSVAHAHITAHKYALSALTQSKSVTLKGVATPRC